ncbi:uncharacterized protein CMC5_084830 [Chondromyces crocatus]|uniref:Uncharacterized protein n=1 Tax=Chondromyces crocatus TaxID=52 RepID=A0A0K1EEL2_CHOCO|nr:uncharacterized protein CMC5_084830 [Chondromyces crocatus]
MRHDSPICRVDPGGCWAVSRHEEAAAVVAAPVRFSSRGVSLAERLADGLKGGEKVDSGWESWRAEVGSGRAQLRQEDVLLARGRDRARPEVDALLELASEDQMPSREGDRHEVLIPRPTEAAAAVVLPRRGQFEHEDVRSPGAAHDAPTEVGQTREGAGDEDMANGGHGHPDPRRGGVVIIESLAPDVIAMAIELGDEDIAVPAGAERSTTEIDGPLESPDENHITLSIGGHPGDGLHCSITNTVTPDVTTRSIELHEVDVVSACAHESAAPEVDGTLEHTGHEHIPGAIDVDEGKIHHASVEIAAAPHMHTSGIQLGDEDARRGAAAPWQGRPAKIERLLIPTAHVNVPLGVDPKVAGYFLAGRG